MRPVPNWRNFMAFFHGVDPNHVQVPGFFPPSTQDETVANEIVPIYSTPSISQDETLGMIFEAPTPEPIPRNFSHHICILSSKVRTPRASERLAEFTNSVGDIEGCPGTGWRTDQRVITNLFINRLYMGYNTLTY